MGPPPDGEDESPPEVLLTEARRVVDEQIKELDRLDRKAARSLQGLFVLFGLLVSAQEFLSPEPVWTPGTVALTIAGVFGWTIGVLFLLFAYSSSDGRFGAVSTMRNHTDMSTVTADSVRVRLLEEYSGAIRDNADMISINSRSVIAGQIVALIGTVAIGLLLLRWL